MPHRCRSRLASFATFALATFALAGVAPAAEARWFYPPGPAPLLDFRPLEDQLDIVRRGREVFAVDAWSGGAVSFDLQRGEEPVWSGVRGRIAMVITDRRLLAIVPGGGRWNERSFGLSESSPQRVLLGDRVAMVVTDRRVLGFEGVSGSWSETDLGRREDVLQADAGTNVAVAVTTQRALGVAAAAGGIFRTDLGLRENLQSLRVHGSFATVTTNRRLLSFRAPEGTWSSSDLPFR